MSIRVECEHCGGKFVVKDEYAGRAGKCKKCGESLIVPELEPEGLVVADGSEEVLEEENVAMPSMAIGAAAIAALLGAIVWAGIAYYAEYELGYIAWGIGAAVGFGARKFGGHGVMVGFIAAALTILSIFGGKYTAASLQWDDFDEEDARAMLDRDYYDEVKTDASDFALLVDQSDASLEEFMLSHGFVYEAEAGSVDLEELEHFKTVSIPLIEKFHEDQSSFTEWQDQFIQSIESSSEEGFGLMEAIISELDMMDLLFLGLGVATAFGICTKQAG